MKATTILNRLLTHVTPNMHKVRRKSVNAMVTSLMSGTHLSVTSLGRHITSQTTEKHQIKRSTAPCSNPHLHAEIDSIYAQVTSMLIHTQTRPIILVDWSELDPRKQHFLLRAAIAVEGRAITLLEKIYPLSRKEKPSVHKQFMQQLQQRLPKSCQPIIVTDAGFRGPWFKLIESMGWDFVGRVRNRTLCRGENDDTWQPVKHLYTMATSTPKALGHYALCRNAPLACQLHVYKGKTKGRCLPAKAGKHARKKAHFPKYSQREKEPWLLATSLCGDKANIAKRCVKIYQSRMQIEESFRDLKTGLNFNESDTRKPKRLAVLLLIGMLAQLVLYLLDMTIKRLGKHLRYQANSLKDSAVLSYQFIGLRAFKDKALHLKKAEWEAAIVKMQQFDN